MAGEFYKCRRCGSDDIEAPFDHFDDEGNAIDTEGDIADSCPQTCTVGDGCHNPCEESGQWHEICQCVDCRLKLDAIHRELGLCEGCLEPKDGCRGELACPNDEDVETDVCVDCGDQFKIAEGAPLDPGLCVKCDLRTTWWDWTHLHG